MNWYKFSQNAKPRNGWLFSVSQRQHTTDGEDHFWVVAIIPEQYFNKNKEMYGQEPPPEIETLMAQIGFERMQESEYIGGTDETPRDAVVTTMRNAGFLNRGDFQNLCDEFEPMEDEM